MDKNTAVQILRDTEAYSTSEENFEKGIWTHIDIEIGQANQIAALIEQQAEQINKMRRCDNCYWNSGNCKAYDCGRELKHWELDGGNNEL